MPTAKDVAALAGVAQSTVSYVMSGKRSISPSTRAKVEAAIAELTYEPNAGARALASRRTNVIGLVVRLSRTTDMAGVLPFIDTITAEARARDYNVVLVTDDNSSDIMRRLANGALVDAIVLMDIRAHDERLGTAASLDVPVVLIGMPEDSHRIDAVDFDFERAGALAVQELVETGHKRIVILGEPPEVASEEFSFIAGFEQSAVRAAVARGADVQVLHPATVGWNGFTAISTELLSQRDAGLGIIARTPQAIGWVLQLLLLERLRPGSDVALVGLCTDTEAVSFSLPVTNVSPEPVEVSRAAMRRVFELLDGSEADGRRTLIAPRITHRETSPQSAL